MKLRKLRNKNGSIVDIAFILVALLGLAIFILIVGYTFPQITSMIKSNSPIGNNTASVAALDNSDNITSRFDTIFLVIFSGLAISVFVTSFFIESSRILIPIYIIALGILIIFAVVASNVYESFAESDTFSTVAGTHPITNFLMDHLVSIAIGVGVLSMILIFAKPLRSGGPF